MKKAVSVIIFTCLALSLMAQNGIKVNYKGSRPTITDIVWAAFPALNYEERPFLRPHFRSNICK